VDIDPVPGDPQRAVLTRVEPLALADSDIKSDDAARNALSTLIDSKYIQQAHLRRKAGGWRIYRWRWPG
jgi:sulfonate transport system substrate-binding protein